MGMLLKWNLGCVGLVLLVLQTHGMIFEKQIPPILKECLKERQQVENLAETPADVVFPVCFSKYFWETITDRYHVYNVTIQQMNWLQSFDREMHAKLRSPVHIPRVRKEIRMLNEKEKCAFFDAVNALKHDTTIKPNMYDAFGRLHKSINLRSSHFGINFLSWHRVLLFYFELALQRKNPMVTLPYWASSLDFDLPNPLDSVFFSKVFVGRSRGRVIDGPFSHWNTPFGTPIMRDVGCPGLLISHERVEFICHNPKTIKHAQIVESSPYAKIRNTVEGIHNGVHTYTGGLMASLEDSVDDPIFYLHHCFVDYIWETFLRKQKFFKINPETDYFPFGGNSHLPLKRMRGFPWVTNIGGFSNIFTKKFYVYQDPPKCSSRCGGSRYLKCCSKTNRCISKTRDEVLPFLPRPNHAGSLRGRQHPGHQMHHMSPHMYRGQHSTGMMGMQGNMFQNQGLQNMGANHNFRNSTLDDQVSFPKLVLTDDFKSTLQDPSIVQSPQNRFEVNGQINQNAWAFVPVRIVFSEMGDPHPEKFSAATYPNCPRYDLLNIIKVNIVSIGINYRGNHRSRVIVSRDAPLTEAYTVTAFKRPDHMPSDFALLASDVYGRVCRPMCKSMGVEKPCTGFLRATPMQPAKYFETRNEAFAAINKWNNAKNHHSQCLFITFVCNSSSDWIW